MMYINFIRYNAIALTGYAVTLAYICFMYLYLIACGENLNTDDIAQRQQQSHLLYLSPLHEDQMHLYKLSLYKLIRPDIVALGSSRMLQFRGEDFKRPFVNMGLSMTSLAQGQYMADEMLKIHTPKIVILGADYWWFSDEKERDLPHNIKQMWEGMTPVNTMMVALWIYQGKISFKSVLGTIVGQPAGYGIAAVTLEDGYDRYGSFHYTSVMEGRRPPYSMPKENLQDIKDGENVMHIKETYDPARLLEFQNLINKFVQAGSHVIVVVPPSYPDIVPFLSAAGKKGLVSDFRAAMRELSVKTFDYTDPSVLGSNACEFIDVGHGGEVTYLRILHTLATHDPEIAAAVDIRRINALISANAGKTEIRRSGYPIEREIDYFGIGCPKGGYSTKHKSKDGSGST